MDILYIEPFFTGSHAAWFSQVKQHSQHKIDLLSMDGRFWKWRMYGGAYTLAQEFIKNDINYDLIIASDMLDLSQFIALTRHKLKDTPLYMYFHENQFAYPWQENSEDRALKRDVHYGVTNYNNALAADGLFFNSLYNQKSFFEGIHKLMSKMPDYPHQSLDLLREKSTVLPIGIHPPKVIEKKPNEFPLIIWNHRMEYDKNPSDFFKALIEIKSRGLSFDLAILGESNKKDLKEHKESLKILENNIVHQGFGDDKTYIHYLNKADIVPVTSIHDFFGISVMEAINYGAYPLLPNRLSYPDLYSINQHPDIFYMSQADLVQKLYNLIKNRSYHSDYQALCKPYYWNSIIKSYDTVFLKASRHTSPLDF